MEPLIVGVASTGGKWTRKDSSYVPMTPEEIVKDIVESFREGASMAHIHARDGQGRPSHDPALFAEIIESVRGRCKGIIIQISTGYIEQGLESKLEGLFRLKPEMASFNLKGSRQEILLTAEIMQKYRVRPVIECFSREMLDQSKKLIDEGILQKPVFYEFVFDLEDRGQLFRDLARDLITREENLPQGSIWSQTRGGSLMKGLQALTMVMGGHVRTGLEDNLYVSKNVKARTSSELISDVVKLTTLFGRKAAVPEESRKILGIS